jgi:hypothetical protein
MDAEEKVVNEEVVDTSDDLSDNQELTQDHDNDSVEEKIRELEERLAHKEKFIRKQQSDFDKFKASLGKNEYKLSETKSSSLKKPDPSDYTDETKYISDVVKWELNQQDLSSTIKSELEKQKQYDSIVKRKMKFDTEAQKLKESTLKDFDEVAKSELMLSIYNNSKNDLGGILESMDNGPQIAYFLGKNVDLAYKLSDMSSTELIPELIRLQQKSAPRKASVTKASEPINPINGSAHSAGEKDPSKMSYKEWLVWREKQLK